jgi:beta-phosphoglucomutase-like phosphatase (HAD superfamily)
MTTVRLDHGAAGLARSRPALSFDALVFDVDGTLADTEDAHRQAFNRAFGLHGLTWLWDPGLYGELLQVTGGKERIAGYITLLDVPAAEQLRLKALIPELHAAKTRFYTQLIALGQVRPRTGVRRLMIEARAAGVRLAIASTTSPENIGPLLVASFGPDARQWFTTIASGDIVPNKKPAPDIYRVALAELGIHPQRAVAFEDSAIGVQAAKGAGLFTVATPNIWTRQQDFSRADLVLSSLGDPQCPLDLVDERRLGAKYLDLEQLAVLHAATMEGNSHASAG